MRLINKEVFKQNKVKGRCYLLSSHAHFVMLCYEITDVQLIKLGCVRTIAMHDCMQLKIKIIIFHAQSIDL